MQQISLFSDVRPVSGQVAKSSPKAKPPLSKTQKKEKLPQTQSPPSSIKTPPKRKTLASAQPAPYGVCHRCDHAIQTPGLDKSWCKACGWISTTTNSLGGG